MKYQPTSIKPFVAVGLAAAFIVIFSCSNERDGFFARFFRGGEAGSAVPVTVESVVVREETQTVAIPAEIELSESADITVPDDVSLERFLVNEGEAVRQGDVVARVSQDELNLRLVRVRTDLRDAQVKLEKASYMLRNRDRLLDEERIDREQYDRLDDDVTSAESEVEKLREDLAATERRAGEAAIVSPIAGTVVKRYVNAGETATAGKPIMTIARMDPATVRFQLSAEQAPLVQNGTIVRMVNPLAPETPASARVTAIAPQLDPQDRTFTVRATMANPQGMFKAGMKMHVELASQQSLRKILIPEEALIRDPRGYFVYTVVAGKAHKVQVIPGQNLGEQLEISRGLNEEDMVVVRGQKNLAEGSKVDIWGR